MALRPIALLALLTLALAGCSDGPPSGDLVPIPGTLTVDGATAENTYTPRSGGQDVSTVPNQDRVCPTMGVPPGVPECVEASSHYKVHFMSLPEPSGDGYAIFQVGGSIEERQLMALTPTPEGMYEAEITKEADESTQFERLELRMGSFVVATASNAAGSQAFVPDPALSGVTVTGSYKGKTLTLDVSGLPGDGSQPQFVGRLYARNQAGNLTVAESFNVVNGAQEYVSKDANIGDYVEFHIHVGTSKIYVYQSTL